MKQAIIWDKTTQINGVEADRILASDITLQQDNIFLVFDSEQTSKIERIESVEVIRSNNKYSLLMSNQDVIDAFLQLLNNPPVQEEEVSNTELAILEGNTTLYEQQLTIINLLNTLQS